jgi:hypothetical protein
VTKRGEIEEASVGRKALINAIADFIKTALPDTTLAPKAVVPKSEAVEFGTQTVQRLTTPPPLPSTSSAGYVFETETSPVITRLIPRDDDDDGDLAGDVSEGEVHAFARKSFGTIATPYLSPYIHRRFVLDAEYGLRKKGDRFFYG